MCHLGVFYTYSSTVCIPTKHQSGGHHHYKLNFSSAFSIIKFSMQKCLAMQLTASLTGHCMCFIDVANSNTVHPRELYWYHSPSVSTPQTSALTLTHPQAFIRPWLSDALTTTMRRSTGNWWWASLYGVTTTFHFFICSDHGNIHIIQTDKQNNNYQLKHIP